MRFPFWFGITTPVNATYPRFGWCLSFVKWDKGGFGYRDFFKFMYFRKEYYWKVGLEH